MKIVIVGAGIGGLTTALCCLHHGHDVVILERAGELGEVGAGIQVPPNAMKVFEALGLDKDFLEFGFQPEALEARMGKSGLPIFNIPLSETAKTRWGAPYFHIHRADYITLLSRALHRRSPNAIKLNSPVVRYEQSSESITAVLDDGQQVVGDVLIGADGIHSSIREQMIGRDRPVFTGNVAWRVVVPVERLGDLAPKPTACVWMGQGRHCVTYRLRGGTLANLVAVIEKDEWVSESWTEQGTREEALNEFAAWHPTIRKMINVADKHYRWALFDRSPLESWIDGRATLLGDAAHPMLPFMAQGAAMAVEDAWALSEELSRHSDVDRALSAYQALRFERTSRMQMGSRANAKTFHKKAPLAQFFAYAPMWLAAKLAPSLVHKRTDTLYGYDVTRESIGPVLAS